MNRERIRSIMLIVAVIVIFVTIFLDYRAAEIAQTEFQNIEVGLIAAQTEARSAKEQLGTTQTELKAIKDELEIKSKELLSARDDLETAKNKAATAEKNYRAAQTKIISLTRDLENANLYGDFERSQLVQAWANLKDLSEKLEKAQSELNATQAKVDSMARECGQWIAEAVAGEQQKGYWAGYSAATGEYGIVPRRNPTYAELIDLINHVKARPVVPIYNTPMITDVDIVAAVVNYAESAGFRAGCAFLVHSYYAAGGKLCYHLICFNTTDKGMVYIEPSTFNEANPRINDYYDHGNPYSMVYEIITIW